MLTLLENLTAKVRLNRMFVLRAKNLLPCDGNCKFFTGIENECLYYAAHGACPYEWMVIG